MSDNLKVALTSTKHISASESIDHMLLMWEKDIPVCSAIIGFACFGGGASDKEKEELFFADICKTMAKTVFIDEEKKWVFVGENPKDSETGLIDYTEKGETEFSKSFFERWKATRTMLMEFSTYDPIAKEFLFCITGLWISDKWFDLQICPTPRLIVIVPPQNNQP